MKRSLRILVLSIAGSLLPNILLASHVSVPASNVSLLAMDTDQVLQAKNGGVTNMLKPIKMKLTRAETAPVKVILTTVVDLNPAKLDMTKTETVKKTLEEFKSLKKATLPHMVKAWGYNRKTDRTRLADEVGIKNYVGTLKQNTLIKNFLLSKIKITDREAPKSVQIIEADTQLAQSIDQIPVYQEVKYRGYIWEVDREKIAEELGIKQYIGSREQNLLIKKYLQTKIVKKVRRNTRE